MDWKLEVFKAVLLIAGGIFLALHGYTSWSEGRPSEKQTKNYQKRKKIFQKFSAIGYLYFLWWGWIGGGNWKWALGFIGLYFLWGIYWFNNSAKKFRT